MIRIAVIGPGAIGLTVAAALEAGRAATVAVFGRRPSPPPVVDWPDRSQQLAAAVQLGPVTEVAADADLVVLAVKAHQTAGSAGYLAALHRPGVPVLVLQNGVEHRERLSGIVPADDVVPGIVWCTAEPTGPGRITVRPGENRIEIPDGSPAVIATAFHGAAVGITEIEDFTTAAWAKLVYNAAVAIEPLTLRRADAFSDPGLREVARRIAAEGVRVGRAAGARLADSFVDEVIDRLSAQSAGTGTSILYDRLAGRAMEWDARNAVISRIGAAHGIPTPVSDIIVPLLAGAGAASS
ncbi:2-dehydropantoate 2-reductase N-terminal domain-containing protein [Nakamurella lactea]|uniref:2-dehydropantoate 2-reductase N-terminal domain-containing protein n=1 Tax=Nakamurella lactea TaxID=459515 RepID=UPI000405A708|nr:2-dehydropantoate 2-reductase N-terminal domain-containing protein [Nakamurella lactea]